MTIEELHSLKTKEIQDFISLHKDESPTGIALKYGKSDVLPIRVIAEQIECHKKAKKKLPTLSKNNLIYTKLSLEQSSGESAASYKSNLISGARLFDVTGGLGVDDAFFVTHFNTITYCELDEVLPEIVKHNFFALGIKNIEVNNTDGIKLLLKQDDKSIDWIYIDPSRRNNDKRSVDLEYCAPNVFENIDLFFAKSSNVMIKVAPAFDLTEVVRKFPNLIEIHVVSVDGECKEVLLLLRDKIINSDVMVYSVSLNSKTSTQHILTAPFSNSIKNNYSGISTYFFVPDCSIIQSNLTYLIAKENNLSFINSKTPYLTGEEKIEHFPGRCFEIITSLKYNEKAIKKYLKKMKISKANIARRDFRISVDEIKKIFKLKDGGEIYLFFTSDLDKKSIMIVAKKMLKNCYSKLP